MVQGLEDLVLCRLRNLLARINEQDLCKGDFTDFAWQGA
jgi:hypothetical protein